MLPKIAKIASLIITLFILPFPSNASHAQDFSSIKCEINEISSFGCLITWSSDGRWIATFNNSSGVNIWNAKTGEMLVNLEIYSALIAWNPRPERSNLIVIMNSYNQISVWDIETGKLVSSYNFESVLYSEINAGKVAYYPDFLDIEWHPSLNQIVITSHLWAGIWEIDTNQFHSLIPDASNKHMTGAFSASWSPDGRYLAFAGLSVRLYDANTLQFVTEMGLTDMYYMNAYRGMQSLTWSPDANYLAIDGINALDTTDIVIRIYDIESGELNIIEGHNSPINALAWSPDGNWIASAGGDDFLGYPSDNAIRIWNTENYELFKEINFEVPITSVSWHPQSTLLAAADLEGTIHLIDPDNNSNRRLPNY